MGSTLCQDVFAVLFMQYTAVAPKMQGLLDKLVYINTTILELPAAMQTAYTNLADAKTNLVGTLVCCMFSSHHMLYQLFDNSNGAASGMAWRLKFLMPDLTAG
jgi:hypothetical protein